MARVVLIGEGMIELSRTGPDAALWSAGYGGDTLNTAIHLARFGRQVGFLTALGSDPFSADLRTAWTDEGIDPALILTDPLAHPGLYANTTDADGERAFTYWRNGSAATGMFGLAGIDAALSIAEGADLLGFSLISLAILPPEGREALLNLAARMRAAGRGVAFDGNYRPRLWQDAAQARTMRDRAIACCTIGLPTLEDEALIGNDEPAEAIAVRWRAGGAGEVAVKLGADGCLIDGGRRIPPPLRLAPRDTSGAGDAFNAGYLHARLSGQSLDAAAQCGQRLAGWVVMRPGAVPPRDGDAPYPV